MIRHGATAMSRLPILAVVTLLAGGALAQAQRDLRIPAPLAPPVFRKVIVCREGATIHDQPGNKGQPVSVFMVFHRLKTDDDLDEKDGFVRVGSAEGTPA